jgi:hypothetical protein
VATFSDHRKRRKCSATATFSTTASHYIEGKKRSVLGFSHLLKNERTVIPMELQNEKSTGDSRHAAPR